MAGRVPQAFIDDLLERTDLVELIQRHVPLKKSGSEFSACCPFHSEKTPSFFVSPQKQFYHCFGCGAHGTAISFLMEHENLSFPEAIGQLAEWAGLEVPREASSTEDEPIAHLLEALEEAARFYIDQLRRTPTAIDYLKKRGIDGNTARDFAIGWAPAGTDALACALGKRFDAETLVTSGLVARRDDGSLRDRFRARILFPIRDRRGRVTGFGGRLIQPGEPKYLNSPESAVFHKSQTIYGLFEARKAETRLEELVVTEGYMDVVGLARAGFRRAVACMGTALTRSHLDLLFRQVPPVDPLL
jgi:DNA primase